MRTLRAFLVDDDDSLRKVLARELGERGFEVRAFASAEGVLDALRAEPPDAILVDLRLPGVGGLDLLAAIRGLDDDAQVVVFTGHGAVPEAVEAMRRGAHDFLTKPVRLDVLEQVLRRAAERRELVRANARLRRALDAGAAAGAGELLGTSPEIAELRASIERVARSESNVLVQGENGTGKELVAREIHRMSSRAREPLIAVNCGAVPEALVESELFGHEKGSFTGADRKRLGLLEAADGGTLFLDEIGELPKAVQPKLLRALQFGEIRPIGSDRSRKVDVRVVAATNRDLLEMIGRSEFREDLYYRVATLVIDVPPLRARPGDVEVLAREFLERCNARSGRRLVIEPAGLQRMAAHGWPGNVRELENAIERLAVMTDGDRIGADAVERHVLRRDRARGDLPTLDLEELEKLAIEAAMRRCSGDKKAAAALLGIALKTLYNMLDRYGMRPPRTSGDER